MNTMTMPRSLAILIVATLLSACVGTQTFTTAARPGETVALAIGWNKTLTRQNMTVTITPSSGAAITYAPNDIRVRAVMNLYPDPASRAVVGYQTTQSLGGGGYNIGSQIAGLTYDATTQESDNDYWQTTVFLDLPTTLPVGTATIAITGGTDAPLNPMHVEVLPGSSVSNPFNIYTTTTANAGSSSLLYLFPNALIAMERAPQSTVIFSGTTTPHSIQAEFSHTPGIGKTWVVNPRGDIKNVIWSDTGTYIKVILTPTSATAPYQMIDFKFYISGGITGLAVTNVKAYDINGAPVTGVTASIK